jgi:hypothetical protein
MPVVSSPERRLSPDVAKVSSHFHLRFTNFFRWGPPRKRDLSFHVISCVQIGCIIRYRLVMKISCLVILQRPTFATLETRQVDYLAVSITIRIVRVPDLRGKDCPVYVKCGAEDFDKSGVQVLEEVEAVSA